jgi:hypothetical protein
MIWPCVAGFFCVAPFGINNALAWLTARSGAVPTSETEYQGNSGFPRRVSAAHSTGMPLFDRAAQQSLFALALALLLPTSVTSTGTPTASS